MARPKGSKNKSVEEETPIEETPKEDPKKIPNDKIFIGYHPITGAEVWQ